MSYIDWEYYSSLSGLVTDEQVFNRLNRRAENMVNVITHARAKQFENEYDENIATDFQKQVHEQIKNTVCDLIDSIDTQESAGMGTGVASVSNDGYTESYKITTAEEKQAQLQQIVIQGLSGTGLAGAL